jgi:proline iminopeptidase
MFTTTIKLNDINLFTKVFHSNLDAEQKIDPTQETLILLHGGPGMDHSHYLKTWAKYIDHCQLIMFDQRGNGRSNHGDINKWTLHQWAIDVAQLCEIIGFKQKPFIGGMSFGSAVAMRVAIDFPNLPAGLVLAEVDARFNKTKFLEKLTDKVTQQNGDIEKVTQAAIDVFANYNEKTAANYFELVSPYFASKNFNGINDYDAMIFNPACSKKYIEGEFQTMDLRTELHKVTCPVLIVTGDQNPFHSIENAEEVRHALPAHLVEFYVFTGEGTELHNHVPETMMALIKNFIVSHA